jgi:NOL1/NOP2/fmu family ribosome biogenesis protein
MVTTLFEEAPAEVLEIKPEVFQEWNRGRQLQL